MGGGGEHYLYVYPEQETYLLFTHYYFLIVQFCSMKCVDCGLEMNM